MSQKSKRVTDTLGRVYEIDKKLASGGQGTVFSVKNGNFAVKILGKKSGAEKEKLYNQLTQLRLLPIEELPLARLIERLQPPHLGYVMDLLTGMVPLSKLIDFPQNESNLVEWYFQGGGLRRRLYLLARCAEVFARLHGKSLVYADPSPGNIFISEDADGLEVRLIDIDNLHYESSPASIPVYTPGYGAPELVGGKSGVNTLTDAHAFAVIAFQTLCLVHPLKGDLVENGEPEIMEKALAGMLPWIDDPDDFSNQCSWGIPREIVLSKGLRELAERCFGEGLRNPLKRPKLTEWQEKLYAAADATIECPECEGTYYFSHKKCPWCDYPRPDFLLVRVGRLEPGKRIVYEPKDLPILCLSYGNNLILTSRIFDPFSNEHTPEIELTLERDNRVYIRRLSDRRFWSSVRGTKLRELRETKVYFTVKPDKQVDPTILHSRPLERGHRAITFQLFPGEKL